MARKKTSATKTTSRKAGSTRKESSVVRPQKPVFRAGTWVTLLLLAGLIGFAFYLKREKETAAEATPTGGETAYVFAATEGTVSSVEIDSAVANVETVRFARDEKNVWVMELPTEDGADQGLTETAASQIAALRVISPVDGKPSVFGFDIPAYIFTIKFASGKTHTLEVGDRTPTDSGYYVRVDKDKMMITGLSGIDALLDLALFPPYLNPPNPTSLPATETPVPPTEAVITPAATVTPTP